MTIPPKHYFYAISILFLLIIYRVLFIKFNINLFKKPIILAILTISSFSYETIIKLFSDTYIAIAYVKKELDILNQTDIKSEWENAALNIHSIYDDYILVIGESARRDYHHAYGYPIENTPFMSTSKGTLINGLTAGGNYTIGSLKLMLTKPDTENWKENYALNLIDLIKLSGLKTYWISNQGYLGEWDTPISSIAKKSHFPIFIKNGAYDSKNTDDTELLPIFEKIILEKSEAKRFIALHLYGYHPNACDRVERYRKIFSEQDIDEQYKYINCYISSIKKTDELIKEIYNLLMENYATNQRSFSLVYFSDHGQCHVKKSNMIYFDQNCTSKLHNDIPLFKISSDDTDRKEYIAFKSGLNFTDGIANWIGIDNAKLNKSIDLFSPNNDPQDYGLKEQINARQTPEDPAINIKK